jgi:hypothetical protein
MAAFPLTLRSGVLILKSLSLSPVLVSSLSRSSLHRKRTRRTTAGGTFLGLPRFLGGDTTFGAPAESWVGAGALT